MAHTITIPDVGDIDFPDSMSDTDIAAAAKRLHTTAQVGKTGPVSRFVSNAAEQANPVSLLSGMGESMLHPLQAIKGYLKQNSDLADKVEAAIKRGDHGQALKHFGDLALQVIPGLGATSDAAGEQIAQGDVAGGLGKSAGAALGVVEASALTKLARGTAEVIHATPSVVGAAARAGGGDVAGGALKAGAGAAVQALPIPHELKLGAGFELGRRGAAQIAKGVKEGYKAGADVVKNRNVIPPATPQPEVVAPPGAATPEMLKQAGVPFTAEEQALADHIMAGVEPQEPSAPTPTQSATAAPQPSEALPQPTAPEGEMTFGSKKATYAEMVAHVRKLGKASTDTLQRNFGLGYGMAQRVLGLMEQDEIVGPSNGSKPRAILTGNESVAPPAADYESIPLQGPAEGNVIPIRPEGAPVQPGIQLPGGQGSAVGPEVPALDAQRAFAEAMTGDPSGGTIPAPASVHPPAEAFEGAYRAKRAQVLADHFHQNGLTYEDVGHLSPGDLTDSQWEALLGKDPDTGTQFRKPSQQTIDQARVFLAGKSAAARSPKAMAAAQALQSELGPEGSNVAPKVESAAETPAAPSIVEPKPKAQAKAKKVGDLMNQTGKE